MPQQPNITGLGALGDAIANGGRDYLNISLAQKQRDTARSNQLTDVADARAYNEKLRSEHLEDEKTMMEVRAKQAGLQILRNEGLLPLDREPTPEEFDAASKQFAAAGLDKVYAELLTTPGPDGAPLLTQADKTNPAKVQAAKDALGAIKATQLKFSMGQPGNAQTTVNELSARLAKRKDRIQQLSAKLDAPPRQFGPNDGEVLSLAVQLAEQMKPGSGQNKAAVAQMVPDAMKELNDRAMVAHAQELQSVKEQLNAERYGEATDTQALSQIIQTSKVFPSANGAVPAPSAAQPTVAAPQAATPEQIAAAMKAALGGGAGRSTSDLSVPTNADPETQQFIAKQNEAQRQQAAAQLIGPLEQQEAQLQKEITYWKGAPSIQDTIDSSNAESGSPVVGTMNNDPRKAQQLSRLFLQLKDVQDKKAALKAQQLGVPAAGNMMTPDAAPAAVLANPVPTFSAPRRPLFQPSAPILQSITPWYGAPAGN